MKKYCNKKTYLICSLVLIVFIYFISLLVFGTKDYTIINKPVRDVLTKQPKLEDDYYNNMNYKYLSKNQLKDDEAVWYYMYTDSQKAIDDEKIKIIDDILNNCDKHATGSVNEKICLFYKSYKVEEKDDIAKKELKYYIDLIKNTNNITEYLNAVLNVNRELSVGIIVNPLINFQPSNLKQPYFTLDNIYYDNYISESEYYSLDSYAQELNKLKKYDVKLLKLYGYKENDAYKMVNDIQLMYKEIARFAVKSEKLIDKGYKLYDINDLQKELKNINLNLITNKYNHLYNGGLILVSDINQLKAIDAYLVEDNLDTLKKYAELRIITEYSEYLGDDFFKLNNEFKKNFSGEEVSFENDKEFIYAHIYSLFQDTIVNEFSKRNLTSSEKQFYTKLILEEIDAFKKRISTEEWLSEKTKSYALDKMNKISYTVGVPDNFVFTENSYLISKDKSYLGNVVSINKSITNEYNNQLRKGNIIYGLMDPLMQNAYYEANTNSINLLLGMIYSYKKTMNLDSKNLDKYYYEILGTAGATIGHELTHALDSEGSKYDGDGNYINWWTEEDLENFNKLNIEVVKYYNTYEQFGTSTLAENIADLGGMELIMDIAKNKKATNADYKKIFEYYTLDWCSQKNPYAKVGQLYYDVHSPDKNRVNAVLSSTEEFYSVYEIKEKDGMFVSLKDRVTVW